ncbi:MAG: ice-binding family protein [Candidatus Omnitrophota bacterium]|nr:ice-binding family protein [Candidatus Omnitrophota bacterium]
MSHRFELARILLYISMFKIHQNSFLSRVPAIIRSSIFLVSLPIILFCDTAWAVDLGTALDYAVLASSAVTNTGPTTINGDLGVWPGTSFTGSESMTINGTVHLTDADAQQAQSDLTAAYNTIVGLSFDFDLSGQDLGTVGTLFPGVYRFSSSAQLTGALTLDAQGNDDAQFFFQVGSALTTASGSSVLLLNGSEGDDVFWQVGNSATLGATTLFQGNILALTSITLNTGAQIGCGRALARNGAVTLDSNTISSVCDDDDGGNGGGGSAVPEPNSLLLVGFGMSMLAAFKTRFVKK